MRVVQTNNVGACPFDQFYSEELTGSLKAGYDSHSYGRGKAKAKGLELHLVLLSLSPRGEMAHCGIRGWKLTATRGWWVSGSTTGVH